MRFIAGLLLLFASATGAQTFTASKTTGAFPIATVLTWDYPGAASCVAGGAGSGPGWSGAVPVKGTRTLTGINVDMNLTLACLPPPGTGSILVQWTHSGKNTNGTTLTDLGGWRILYSTGDLPTFDRALDVAVPSANAFRLEKLAAGKWHVAVATLTQPCVAVPPVPVDCRMSDLSTPPNVHQVAGTTGETLPTLTVAIDGYTVPDPPTNVTTSDVIAYEIYTNSAGVFAKRERGYVELGVACDHSQQRQVGTVTYTLIPMLQPFYANQDNLDLASMAGKVKPTHLWAVCT